MNNKDKLLDKIATALVVLVIGVFLAGLFTSVWLLAEEAVKGDSLDKLNLSFGKWIIISLILYLFVEIMFIFNERHTKNQLSFGDFFGINVLVLLFSVIEGYMIFPSFYLVKSIVLAIPEMGFIFGKGIIWLFSNPWVTGSILLIVGFIGLKYTIWKYLIKKKKDEMRSKK